MRVNQEFAVAVHALLMLDCLKDEKVTSEQIAESAGCNPTNVRKIFKKLTEAKLVITKSGKGKTVLARPAEKITLWDIYAAVEPDCEGDVFRVQRETSSTCQVGARVPKLLAPHLAQVVDAMREEMSAVTLAQLSEELKEIN